MRRMRASCARRARGAADAAPRRSRSAPGLSPRDVTAAVADDTADAAVGGDSFTTAHALVAAAAVSSARATDVIAATRSAATSTPRNGRFRCARGGGVLGRTRASSRSRHRAAARPRRVAPTWSRLQRDVWQQHCLSSYTRCVRTSAHSAGQQVGACGPLGDDDGAAATKAAARARGGDCGPGRRRGYVGGGDGVLEVATAAAVLLVAVVLDTPGGVRDVGRGGDRRHGGRRRSG